MTNFQNSIDCTGDVVVGDTIQFTEAVFTGSYRNARFSHERTITAVVVKDSYGAAKQQHTFTLEVIACDDGEYQPGTKTTRKGRNVYRNGTRRLPWADEAARKVAAEEKHERGDEARMARAKRKARAGMYA